MQNGDAKLTAELQYLRELEFGDKTEAITRLVSVSGAGILIYFYTGWPSALIWSTHFVAAWSAHTIFTYTRKAIFSPFEIAMAAFLFGNLQIAFGWLPLVLFMNESRPLMLVGGALISAQLLFLVRRNDSFKIYQIVQVAVVIFGSIVVYASYYPDLDTPLAVVGAALALVGLNYYFVQSLRVARRMRLSRAAATRRANQATKMAAVGQLAGGVAHDFNNNLTAIIGSLELARLTEDPEEREEILDNALVASNQAAQTVKQLMIFARKERPTVSEIQTGEVFSELVKLTERLIPTSIKFEILDDNGSLPIQANQNQLLSGLVNLVANSIDAMPQGGVLRLWSQRVRLEKPLPMTDGANLDPGEYVRITLEDSGQGIPEGIIMNVIDPFFTTKPVGKGSGLGLSMVSGMMKELNGGLSIKSNQNGTAINLFLRM